MAEMITETGYFDSEMTNCAVSDTINASLTNVAESFQYRKAMVIYTTVVLPIILVVGILDNALFLIVVQRTENMKTVTNAYLANLAVSDTLFLTLAIGHKLWKIIGSPKVVIDDSCLGSVGCVIAFVGCATTHFASLCFITLVSWQRRQAVRCPHSVDNNRFHHRIIILFSWVISFLLASSFIPSFTVFKKLCIIWPNEEAFRSFPREVYVCNSVSKDFDTYTFIAQALPFFCAMIVNLILYFDIIRGLRESADRVKSSQSLANASSRKSEERNVVNQIIRMLVINGLIFFAFLAPFEILAVSVLFNGWSEGALFSTNSFQYKTIAWVARTLVYLNALINPVIYTAFSSRYRKAFYDTICEIYGIILCRYSGTSRKRRRPIPTAKIVDDTTNDWNDSTKNTNEIETTISSFKELTIINL